MRSPKKWNWVFVVVIVVVLAQFRFFNPVRDALRRAVAAPVDLADTIYSKFHTGWVVISTAKDLNKENANLKDQVLQLQAQVGSLRSVGIENEQLRQELNFTKIHPQLTTMPASVISVASVDTTSTITIDKGSNDGIKSGQAVVSQGFLVGKIGNVSQSTAEVLLLASRDLLTPVTLTDTNTAAILNGGIQGLVINDIPLDTKVTTGELVITSSLEQIFPAGIAVGQVDATISQRQDIFVSVRVSSPINPGALTEVFIITQP